MPWNQMISPVRHGILQIEDIKSIVRPVLRPATGVESRVVPNADNQLQELKSELLRAVTKLDTNIKAAIESNCFSIWLRYAFLILLSLLIVAAIAIAVLQKQYALGAIETLVPTGLFAWFLNELRKLQDERIWLLMKIPSFEPRIVACTSVEGLQSIAQELYAGLDSLASSR